MAQAQPMGEGGRQAGSQKAMQVGLSNVLYDLVTVLSNCGEAVEALDQYLDDARQAKDTDVVNLFEQIRQDEVRHCEMTRQIIDKMVRQGKL